MNCRAYMIDTDDENLSEILSVCVENINSFRKSNDGSKAIVKLCNGDTNNYPFFDKYQELNEQEAFDEMKKPEWQTFGNQEDD